MSVDKLFNIVSGTEYQLNILKDAIKVLDKEEQGKLDETYRRGYDDATKMIASDEQSIADKAYQRGLDDAWEAARKIIHMPESKLLNIFTECYSAVCTALQVLLKYDASEAIEKLKAYEEKQNDKIEVGDDVLWFMKGDDEGCDDIMDVCAPSVVTMVPNKECDDYTIIESSGAMTVISKEQIYKKTGRHFDIASILEDMRND